MIAPAVVGTALMLAAAWLAASPPKPVIHQLASVLRPPRIEGDGPQRIRRDDAAFARAFAYAAARRDGRILTPLDQPALGVLEDAEILAATEPLPLAGPGLGLPGFTPAPLPAGLAVRQNPAYEDLVEELRHLPVAGDHMPSAVTGSANHKVIIRPAAVAKIEWNPASEPGPLLISDRSGGQHGLRLVGPDFGSIRVDGGLVAPGRLYRINARSQVISDVPVVIEIRPLVTATAYWDAPMSIPVGGG